MITTPCIQGGFIGQSAENFIPSVLSDTTGVWLDPSDIRLNWRRNFARYSEDVTNAAWVKTGATASASNLFVETAVSGEHYISQTITMGGICTFTFEVKDSSTGRSIIRAATGATSATYGVVFDLNSNAFSTIGTAIISCTSTVLADGYTRISITSNAGVSQIRVQTTSSGTTTYLGDITKGLYVRNLQVEYGSTFTGYQKITDGLADYSTYTGITIPTMYQDSVGTTIASQVEQPVGLILDKSKRLVIGNEILTNGDFSNGSTGWTPGAGWSVVGGQLVRDNLQTSSSLTVANQGNVFAAGKSYLITLTIVAISGQVDVRSNLGGIASFTTPGTKTMIFNNATSLNLQIQGVTTASCTIDNISVKEVPGYHAYQATTNSRPYLRARQNRLTYSEQFENAAWTKTNAAIQTNFITYSQDFSDGSWTKTNSFVQTNLLTYSEPTTTNLDASSGVSNAVTSITGFANSIQFSDNSVQRYAYKQKTLTAGVHTISVYVQMDDASAPVPGNTITSGDFGLVFESNLVTSTITTTLISGSIYRISGTVTAVGTAGANFGVVKYTGSSSKSFRVTGFQLVQGNALGDYRATTTAALPILYTAPDGTLTANKLLEDNTNNQHRTYYTAVWNPLTYTYSVYLKAAERSFASITHLTVSPQPSIIINLSTGAITSPTNATTYNAVNAGNGWWRVDMTYTNTITTTGYPQVSIYSTATTGTYLGDGSSGIYVWGAQVVLGAVPGNYQRTLASSLPVQYTAPDGTLTAKLLLEDLTNGVHLTQQSGSVGVVGAVETISVYAKALTRSWIVLQLGGSSNAYFDVANGVIGNVTSGTSTIFAAENGWYRCSLTATRATNQNNILYLATGNGASTSYAGDGASGIYIWGADLRIGTSAGKYQRTTATAWNTVGTLDYDVIGQQPYLWFDGTDDSLVTNNINFTATDKMTVCAGVTKLSDATIGSIIELSSDANANSGTFWLFAPNASAAQNWNFRSKGVTGNFPIATQTKAAPDIAVLTGIGDIVGDITTLRYNGTVAQTDITDQGTGNYGTYPLYIGRRGNATLPFTGQLYNLVIAGKAVTASQLTTIEKYVSSKTDIVI